MVLTDSVVVGSETVLRRNQLILVVANEPKTGLDLYVALSISCYLVSVSSMICFPVEILHRCPSHIRSKTFQDVQKHKARLFVFLGNVH